jgi:outer membrane protein TolC
VFAQFQIVAEQNGSEVGDKDTFPNTLFQSQHNENLNHDSQCIALLEQRIKLKKEKLEWIETAYKSGNGSYRYNNYIDAQIAVTDAKIVLYRYTGKQKELIATLEEKLDLSKEQYRAVEAAYKSGSGSCRYNNYIDAQIAVTNAKIILYRYTGKQKELIAALEEKLDLSKEQYRAIEIGVKSGVTGTIQLIDAKLAIVEAELELKQEKTL